MKQGRGFAASPEQRARVKDAPSIVSGRYGCDPAHVWARGRGGCDSPLCCIPLTREEHQAFDRGELDVLPHMLAHGLVHELCHALQHANGDMPGLLHRLTGERWAPIREDQYRHEPQRIWP